MYRIITLLVATGSVIASAQSFEVASVKIPPVASGDLYNINLGTIQRDTVTLTNASLAKTTPGTTREQTLQMMQALLAERFKLALHRERRVLAYYALVVAKGGPTMPEAKDAPASAPAGVQGQLRIIGNRMKMFTVATLLSRYMRAFVVDQTGLAGDFEVKLVWTPDDRPIPEDERGASVFTAVEEQLGLKLVSRRGPMEVLVVDRAEKTPAEN